MKNKTMAAKHKTITPAATAAFTILLVAYE